MGSLVGLLLAACLAGEARAEDDRPSAERRLAPRNDAVFLSMRQIHGDEVGARDVKVSVGAPVLRGDGFGIALFQRYAATWIESERRLPESLVLHRFDLMLGGGARLAPGWSFRGALGVAYASDLRLGRLSIDPFQLTTAAMVRHVVGPSDAWMIGVAYSSSSAFYPLLPMLGYVHQREGSRFRFDALLPHHVRAAYQLTSHVSGALGIETHGDRWLVHGMERFLETRREGGTIFGELGTAVYGPVQVELRAGVSVDRYTLPDTMSDTSRALPLKASAFAQLMVVVAR